jgi:hypothetical protein
MRFIIPVAIVLFGTSCSSLHQKITPSPESIAGNDKIPDDALVGYYDRNTWERVRRTPYDGYVILEGNALQDKSFKVLSIKESFPNDDRNEVAMEYAQRIPVYSIDVNSHVKPKVEVYVVFFETYSTPNRALVFAKQDWMASPTFAQGGSKHVKVIPY